MILCRSSAPALHLLCIRLAANAEARHRIRRVSAKEHEDNLEAVSLARGAVKKTEGEARRLCSRFCRATKCRTLRCQLERKCATFTSTRWKAGGGDGD